MAFGLGFFVRQLGLPPLVGYLAAGFGLHAIGVEPDPSLETLAHLGVTLLLFTVGLKLNLYRMLRPEILVSTISHMGVMSVISIATSMTFAWVGLSYFVGMDLKTAAVIGFALSFSSTVVAVKVLEEKHEMKTRHGQLVLGVLVLQDIAAVLFLVLTNGEMPSVYAAALFGLPLLRPVLGLILRRCGHGEVLALGGFALALTGYTLFESVGLKGDLGALIFGILLSRHHKATELAKTLMHFKDLFLIGFFLSIGFHALPTMEMMAMATLLTLALPVKMALFFVIFSLLRVRARTAFLSAADLSTYSEFGLIVVAISVQQGLVAPEWLVIVSLSAALSYVISSIFNIRTHMLYAQYKDQIKILEHATALPADTYKQPEGYKVLVVGMGRVGTGAYDEAEKVTSSKVWGVDFDPKRVELHQSLGRHVIRADVEDVDFWETIDTKGLDYIMLALPSAYDVLETVKLLKFTGYKGKITSIAKFEDDRKKLLAAGVDVVFNFYSEAGVGLAEETFRGGV